MQDLVDDSCVLTGRGYSHIKKYPHLIDEQRQLPVSHLENPHSEAGNTDVYFFGVSGSGKSCVLAGLMSLTGQLGFRFDPRGPGGGNYAIELRNYARTSMLPPATDQNYIQVIDAQINDEDGNLHKISMIEMSGEKTAEFAAIENPTSLEDLGAGAAGLLGNDNNKVLFFVIDPTNEKNVQMGCDSNQWVMQSDVLDCVSSLLSKTPGLMKKVVAIHVILTKSDTLGDYVDQNVIQHHLTEQGYSAVLASIKAICQKYDINKQTGFQVGLYPFCIGKFMPGDVYTFDETDSLKILRVIQSNVTTIGHSRKNSFMDHLKDWVNDVVPYEDKSIKTCIETKQTFTPQSSSSGSASFWSRFFTKNEKFHDTYSSVFAPAEVKHNSRMMVQVYLHLNEETEKVKALATEADKNAERRDYIPLQNKLKKGDKVDVVLNINGDKLLFDSRKSIIWQGSFCKCAFDYLVPSNLDVDELSCSVNLYVNGAIVGELLFYTQIVDSPTQLNANVIAKPVKKLFISYSHNDLKSAEKIAKLYEGMDVDVFFDKHRLKSGYIYSEEIFNFIRKADTFVLCWSENAAQSEYVEKERKAALELAYPNYRPREGAKSVLNHTIYNHTQLHQRIW